MKQGTITTSGGYCTGFTLSDGTTLNFNPASAVTLSGSWSDNWTKYKVDAIANGVTVATIKSGAVTADMTAAQIKAAIEADPYYTTISIEADGNTILSRLIDARGVRNAVGFKSTGSWSSGSRTITLDNDQSTTISMPSSGTNWTLTNTAQHYATASVTVGGKTYSQSFNKSWINGTS